MSVGTKQMSAATWLMSVDKRQLSAAIGRMSAASRPWFPPNRGLQVVSTHSHQEDRMSKRFPRSEPDIATLAARVVEGLTQAAEDFPAPPVPADELRGKLEAFTAADTAIVTAETAFRDRHAAKDSALAQLVDALKADLRYAEVAVRDAPQKLSALGWRAPRDGTPLQPPGETRDITIVTEGDTWAILRWNAPTNGGAPAFYRIQRRQEGAPWEDAGTTTGTEQLMSNQPRGVELHYRVVAVNKAGDGQPSATVTLVL